MSRARRDGTVGSTMAAPAATLPRTPSATRASRRDLAVDAALAAASLAITLFTLGQEAQPLRADGIALSVVSTLPLLVWRRAPLAVFVVTAAASVGINALGYDLGLGVGPTVMVFFLGRMAPDARPAITGFAIVGFFFAQVGADYADGTWSPLPIPLLGWLLVWSVGERMRERAERETAREEKAERDRDLAVAHERTRIARDLHDSAGHAINVILVQAGAARLLGERDPAAAAQALRTIEDVARETIDEIDRMVGALRDDETPVAPRGLAVVDALADRYRAGGLDVTIAVRGDARPLPAATDQAAYGILREALTNAARHGTGTVAVEVEHRDDGVHLVVTNPTPPGWAPRPERHGIVGMRERAALVGGRLTAGAEGGEFRVRAELP
jgi:signal transduction histidine kinase